MLKPETRANSGPSTAQTDKRLFAEFFAGIGLVHLGLNAEGWKCVYANDIASKKHEMYCHQFGHSPQYHIGDIWKTDDVVQRITVAPFLATASFPCVDLSLAGNQEGLLGKDSSTFYGFLNVLNELHARGTAPKAVMIENVMGFLNSRSGKDFRAAAEALADLGYHLDGFVVDAKHFAPQSRPRLFLVGSLEAHLPDTAIKQSKPSLPQDAWLDSIDRRKELRPAKLTAAMKAIDLATGWVQFDLPELPPICGDLPSHIDVDDAQDWWEPERVQKHLDEMSDAHRERVNGHIRGKRNTVGTIYRRVRQGKTRSEIRTDGLAGCLRTPRGGSSKQIVFVAGKGTVRMRWMSPVEYARLQGAPNFPIKVGRNQALFGFGDAVCVPAISWIARNVLNQLH